MDLSLALCRFAHFASMLLLFGASFYIEVLSPAPARRVLADRFARFAAPLASLALASAILGFALTAWSMSGEDTFSASAALDVITGTDYGRVCAFRALLLFALAALSALRRPGRGVLLILAFALATLGLTGHAAMQEGALGAAHRANDALHLLLVAGWLGGLPPFIACLRLADGPDTRPGVLAAMMRFSLAGHFATPLILVTGAVNVALTTGAFPWPLDTPYRSLLALKVLVFAAMLGIALANRYLLVPRLGSTPYAAAALRAMTLVESLLSLVAVAAVSFFGLLDPN